MISLDQVLLLEQKVESAVEKIRQLQNENDALRKKCSELTNALSSKSEQLSNFETAFFYFFRLFFIRMLYPVPNHHFL